MSHRRASSYSAVVLGDLLAKSSRCPQYSCLLSFWKSIKSRMIDDIGHAVQGLPRYIHVTRNQRARTFSYIGLRFRDADG